MNITGKLYIVEKSYSNYGNAKYLCIIVDEYDNSTTFSTKPNSSLAIDVSNNKGKIVNVELTLKRDKYVLTSIDIV